MDDKNKKRTLAEVLKGLAESSSLHGIPKIASSRQLPVKILWCAAVLAGVGVLTYQLVVLFQTFYSNPIQTTVSLDFNILQFPAISICNMNPIRKSKIGLSPKLQSAIMPKKRRGSEAVATDMKRRKRASGNTASGESIVYRGRGLPNDKELIAGLLETNRVNSVAALISRMGHDPNLINDTYFEIHRTYINSVPKYRMRFAYPYNSVDHETEVDPTMPSHDNHNSTEENESDQDDIDWDIFAFVDTDDDPFIVNYTTLRKPMAKFLKDPKDKWDLVSTEFKRAFRDVSLEERRLMGHQVSDFIQYASFAKRQQNVSEYFKQFTSSEYGNCYTMDDSKFTSWRSGPESGIKLTLYLEVDEYVGSFSSGYGVRIVFHEPGTFPMPVEEGLTISAGFETSIGLRAINLTRLGQPYGQCTNHGSEQWQRKHNLTYSKTACLEFCRIESVIDKCNCIPIDAPDIDFREDVNVCRRRDEFCTFEVELLLENGTLQCDCINPCSEFVYGKTMTGRMWPHKDYWKHILMKDMCAKNLVSLAKACKDVHTDGKQFDYERYRNNFVRVVIYFEDLNYEKITEEPFYTTVRFVCDIGGAMGLFIGVSILSLFEVLQLVVEIILYLEDRRQRTPKNNVPKEKTSDCSSYENVKLS